MSIISNLERAAQQIQEQVTLLSTRITLLEKANEKTLAKLEELNRQLQGAENQLSEVKQIAMRGAHYKP